MYDGLHYIICRIGVHIVMGLMIGNMILSSFILFIVPSLVGNTVIGLLRVEKGLAKSFVLGLIAMWGICQFVTVPFVLLKADFRIVFGIFCVVVVGICIYGIYKKWFPKFCIKTDTVSQKLALVIMLLAIGAFLTANIVLQHTDADDSRFVVNAVDIIRTNTMFLTNPATGEALEVWEGELIKDVTSPWAVFIACLAKSTGIHATIMAHTFMPVMLLLMACCVFWLLSEEFFGKDISSRCILVCLVLLLNVYGYYSVYSAETFLMTRIWQGKAVVAGIGVPLLILEFLWLYRQEEKKSLYILLLITQFGLCLLSGMGIIIGAIMAGCYGLVYGIAKKNWKMLIAMWASVIPNVVYYGINTLL